MDAQQRLILAIAEAAHQEALSSGFPSFFDNTVEELAERVGASKQDARQVIRKLCESGYLFEQSAGFFNAMPSLLLLHEQRDRPVAYRQNAIRRYVLQEVGRFDAEGGSVQFKADEDDPYPKEHLFTAAKVLDALGLVELMGELPAIFNVRLAARGYDALHDERLLCDLLPLTATDDAEAHMPIAPDALRAIITSCEQMLVRRGWRQVLVELQRGDTQYNEAHWVDAVREYYAALESGLKYALGDEGASYAEGSALNRLAGRASDSGLIPTNYQAVFGYADSIRSPRSHGAGPRGEVGEVEVGQAEALLMGNLVRTLLLYLGNRPAIA